MFQHIISLGSNCLVASAMSKYGFRSCSGPFDWCTSNFMEGVICFLENNFNDFMKYDNLKILDEDNPKTFDDVRHKINYNHDVATSLDDDYKSIYSKYMRRINLFREITQEPTCFIRGCWSPEELSTYVEYEDKIRFTIKKSNPENELIIVVPKFVYDQNPISCNFKLFIVDVITNGFEFADRNQSRAFFDSNEELIDYLTNNYPESKRKDNLIWDLRAELAIAQRNHGNRDGIIKSLEKVIIEKAEENNSLVSRINRWNLIENKDFSTLVYPNCLAIYGCGAIGRIFSQKIGGYTKIIEFLDQRPRQEKYNNIPVNRPEDSDFKYSSDIPIVIIPSNEYDEITQKLKSTFGNQINTIRLENFLASARTIDSNF